MNKPLRRVALAMMVMVVLLMGNATYIQVIQASELRDHALNKRTQYEEFARERGQIIAGGQSLARSVPNEDNRYKWLRTYPNGPMYAPVTGFYSFYYGSNGIERAEDKILTGKDDSLAFDRLSDMITGKESRGGSVELTINTAMQEVAYKELTSKGFSGSVVALDPRSGEILTMVNAPSYDPGLLTSTDNNEVAKQWNNLSEAEDNPMSNRAVSEIYPPGSTFKMITTAAALQNGYKPDSKVETAARIPLPGTASATLPNYGSNTCRGDTLTAAVAYSCNTAFAKIAGELGPDKLRETAAAFGFGDDLQIPMSVAKSDLGAMADTAALYQSGIGQRDVRVTPLQNAMMTAAIANGGKLMKPQLVKNTRSPDMSELDTFQPEEMKQSVSPEIARMLRDMMIQSEKYTKGSGKISNVEIASKTGTAQHGDPGDKPHGWYVAFAPAENPTIAVAVIVENGGDEGAEATGGSVAAPIGREVIRAGLQGGG
ncbi:cell elongation-specific peptidoglycan D,D-transpeptidase [Saccharopolyspora kobensis]|uniref:Cell elongation-specific peptidoglycan D,D-transpeptidase n=1 Tax=Saccharopolyspora kobensis TaxID=146035 RepID=A0A1H6DHS9_9PSEU|nr:penicillin-binding protein 2 [Saccharopolyspora kobensis]SEG84770.1 cell elongation-specific peptidoglycan D,D-transpeptidase [Saccharopolyspora kobensis]SFD26823.1 cell elongation-specific peptidoglycan D,D-transpeptidase [Saccharopolyspora kobensis]